MKTKRKSLIFSCRLLLTMAIGCKDDESPLETNVIDSRPAEEVVEALSESLATADSISAFTEALKTIVLSQEDIAQGLTIFAPLNEARPGNGRISSNSKTASPSEDTTAMTDEAIKDHIIKGVLKFSDFTDGTTFVSLSGKTYKITKSGEQTWINGVLILPKELLSGTKETVFAVKSLLTNTLPTDTPLAEEDINQQMSTAANDFANWNANVAVLDGLLSDDADTPPAQFLLQGAQELDNFTFTPNNQTIGTIWTDAFAIINNLNLIIANEPQDTKLLANARGLRAYIYLRLTNYFGGLPLHLEYSANMMDQYKTPKINRSEVIDFVISELNEAKNLLPTDSEEKSILNSTSTSALLAKAYLLNKDYNAVYSHTQTVINSMKYELSTSSVFDQENPETVWGNATNLPANLEAYFNLPILTYVRLTEVYLMNAEANIENGNLVEATDNINMLLTRSGSPTIMLSAKKDLTEILRSLWKSEMAKEGNRFVNLVRWETTLETLYEKNFMQGKSELIPIPQFVVDGTGGSIYQNPGY